MGKQETQKPIKIYLSGGIKNVSDFEERFAEAEEIVLRYGFVPISPVKKIFEEFTYQDQMAVDLAILSRCDGIYMLKGWAYSEGAELERRYAIAMGIPVYYSEYMLEKAKNG